MSLLRQCDKGENGTLLFPTRKEVDNYNTMKLDEVPGKEFLYPGQVLLQWRTIYDQNVTLHLASVTYALTIHKCLGLILAKVINDCKHIVMEFYYHVRN